MIEIDSFVTKFKNLWHATFKASLTIESEYGQASVTLKTGLGFAPPPFSYHNRQPPRHRGPSYQRRQERRQAARTARTAAGNLSAQAEHENDSPVNEVAEEVTDDVQSKNSESETEQELESCELENGKIPQIDGANDEIVSKDMYCKVCRECPEEMESKCLSYSVLHILYLNID